MAEPSIDNVDQLAQIFATFDGMGVGTTNGLSAMVKQLLGINRAVVA
mgnify:CR=1 FL=1